MAYKKILICSCFIILKIYCLQAQSGKFDSTATIDGVGYMVSCNNKHADLNNASVFAKGFKGNPRSVQFPVKGRVHGMAVEDLNGDGFPDIVLFVYNGVNEQFGEAVGITGKDNASLQPVFFPDIYSDPKLRQGYKGHDSYSIVIGLLQRSFPLYKTDDGDTATGSIRIIQYKIVEQEGVLSFKVLRSYDEQKP